VEMGNPTTDLSDKGQSPGRGTNPGPPKYEAGVMFPTFRKCCDHCYYTVAVNSRRTIHNGLPFYVPPRSRDSSVFIAMGYMTGPRLLPAETRGSSLLHSIHTRSAALCNGCRKFPAGTRGSSLHSIQTKSRPHPACYVMAAGDGTAKA
jgi:hypothetical protein